GSVVLALPNVCGSTGTLVSLTSPVFSFTRSSPLHNTHCGNFGSSLGKCRMTWLTSSSRTAVAAKDTSLDVRDDGSALVTPGCFLLGCAPFLVPCKVPQRLGFLPTGLYLTRRQEHPSNPFVKPAVRREFLRVRSVVVLNNECVERHYIGVCEVPCS